MGITTRSGSGEPAHETSTHDIDRQHDAAVMNDQGSGEATFSDCLLKCSQVLANSGTDDRDSIEVALRALVEATRFDRIRIIENISDDASARYAQLTCAVVGEGESREAGQQLQFEYDGECAAWSSMLDKSGAENGAAVEIPDSLREKLKAEDAREMLAFPLFSSGTWIGLITFEQLQDSGEWVPGETGLLTAVAGMLGSHLGRRRAMSSLRRQVALQTVLGTVAKRLAQTQSTSIGAEIDASLEEMGQACGADRASIFKLNRYDGLVTNIHEWCDEGVPARISQSLDFSLRGDLPWLARQLHEFKHISLASLEQLPQGTEKERAWLEARDVESILIIPLLIDNYLFGFLCIETVNEQRAWRSEISSTLHVFGELVAGAIKRKEIDDAIKSSERRYRLIADNATEIITVYDKEHSLVWASPTFGELTGVSADTFVGREISELIFEEDLDSFRRLQALTLKGADGERARVRIATKRGDWYWLELTGKPFSGASAGSEDQYILIGRSIDHHTRVEETLRRNLSFMQRILDTIPDPIYFKDQNLNYRLVNKAFEDFLGRFKRDIIGKSTLDFWEPEVANLFIEMDKALLLKPGVQTHETEVIRGDGSKSLMMLHRASFADENGEIQGVLGIGRDISERNRSEQALRDLEARHKQILNAISDIIIVKSPSSRITWANTAFMDYYNLSEEDLFDYIDSTFNDAATTQRYLEADRRVVQSGKTVVIDEEPITRHDGEVRLFNTVKSPIFDSSGAVTAIVAVCRDITNSKITERALEESNRLFMTLIGNLPGMVYRCKPDDERTMLYASNGCINLTGYTPSELTHNRRVTFAALIHPEDIAKVRRAVKRAVEQQSTYQVTYRINAADGSTRWVWEQGAVEPITNSDELCLEGLILDITDKKAEEESRLRLATAVEQVAEAIMIMNYDGQIEYVNPGFTQVTGYSFEDALGRDPIFLSKGLHDDAHFTQLWATIKSGKAWKGRMKNMHKENRVIECDATISPVRDGSGKITNFVAVERDVTEMVNLEGQLRQAQKLESVGSLAAGIAHEINTPIQFVGDNTHFLADAFLDINKVLEKAQLMIEETKPEDPCSVACKELRDAVANCDVGFYREEIPSAIDQTLQGVDRVATIVRAMKEFSHPDTREKTPIEVNKAITTTLTVARNELKYVADVETEFGENLPAVMGYPGELNQVFLNLLVNASHAIAKVVGEGSGEKGKITVRTYEEEDYLVVEVRDTGCGIKLEDRDRIFDPFYTTKPVGKGTGQGLAIARSVVVDKHGGKIDFETEIGRGTTFFVRLPLSAEGT